MLNGWSVASDLEIVAPESWDPLLILQSTAERVVARTSAKEGIACRMGFRSVLRDSVCISQGEKGAGAGQVVGTNPFPLNTRKLRNVTAIGAGPESAGLLFDISGGEVFIDVKSTIARGTATDVKAVGREPEGGSTITLEASDFASAEALSKNGGTSFVTAPGTGGNITAPPLFAFDGYHELAGSPTVDAGVMDEESGSSDIDGQARAIGSAADIGADELAHSTSTSLSCPASALLSSPMSETACTVTVTDTSPTPAPPSGTVSFSAGGAIISADCTLVAASGSSSACEMTYSPGPSSLGPHLVSAIYGGDPIHDGSGGNAIITVIGNVSIPGGPIGGSGGALGDGSAPDSRLGKHPRRRTTSRTATFGFSSDQSGARFQCQLDRRRYRSCNSPFRARVALGWHIFKVRAVSAGGTDPTPATFRWTVLG